MLFWISVILFIGTNLYWLYTTIDNAVGHNYYQVSCEAWQKDNKELKKLLPLDVYYSEMLGLLENKDLDFYEFEKGDNKIIQFSSIDLIYGKTGELLDYNER
jgi:hypothetical protein